MELTKKNAERGSALTATAVLDDRLGECLKQVLTKDQDLLKQVFGEQGQLSGLGSRLRFAYLLGLITRETYKELSVVNNIRNVFAHKADARDYKHPRIQGYVSNLFIVRDRIGFFAKYADPFREFDLTGDVVAKIHMDWYEERRIIPKPTARDSRVFPDAGLL